MCTLDLSQGEKKHGDVVTYDEDHVSHKRVEFSFDILEIAKGNYTAMAYHDFIGFEVSRPVLERAFDKTYGLDINTVLNDLSIETFRWSVNNLFPVLTKAAWAARKNEIRKLRPTATSRSYVYKFKKADYYKEFGHKRQKPGPLATLLGVFIRVSPKVGPLRPLRFKSPGPQGEKLFVQSFDSVSTHYGSSLNKLRSGSMKLENVDFDTGKLTTPREYPPADKTYGRLLLKLKEKNFELTNNRLRQNILDFYAHRTAPNHAKKTNTKACKNITTALEQLRREEPNSLSHNR